jgi:hypothetical protein
MLLVLDRRKTPFKVWLPVEAIQRALERHDTKRQATLRARRAYV